MTSPEASAPPGRGDGESRRRPRPRAAGGACDGRRREPICRLTRIPCRGRWSRGAGPCWHRRSSRGLPRGPPRGGADRRHPAGHPRALHRKQAHAVVCDLASVPAACILALLAAHPHLLVVIVDPDADRAMALTCRRPPMRTIDDLVAALPAMEVWTRVGRPWPVPPCPAPHGFPRGPVRQGRPRRRLWVMAATPRRAT
jgi:hypothetical protein